MGQEGIVVWWSWRPPLMLILLKIFLTQPFLPPNDWLRQTESSTFLTVFPPAVSIICFIHSLWPYNFNFVRHVKSRLASQANTWWDTYWLSYLRANHTCPVTPWWFQYYFLKDRQMFFWQVLFFSSFLVLQIDCFVNYHLIDD